MACLVGTREADDWLHSISAKLTVVLPDADLGTGASAASELENIAWFVEQALQIIEFGQGVLASMRRF